MGAKKNCRNCGAETVSTADDPLCFSCQISRVETEGGGNTGFFFDELDDSRQFDGLEERLAEALDTIDIEGEIGRGGMGVVFRGRQKKLDRAVAVKVLPPMPGADESFSVRFLTEARAMARMHHPNIVAIHDFGQTPDDLSYIVMEFVKGRPLSEISGRQILEPKRCLGIMAQIAEALAYAHGLEVVHRDMKPQNVLVDEEDRPKIADFGIAKLEGERHSERLTKTHQILGTPLYMAPEQAVGAKAVDHRADLYALGVMMFEGLTGLLPDKTVDADEQLARFDPRVKPLVNSLLEKKVARRADSAAEIAKRCHEIARTWDDRPKKRGLFGRMFRS
ncbi:MAG: serine/threonine-protein kinase [Planctomycetota bacterium]